MKPNERQLLIIDILHQQGKITVKELVSHFEISAETIRRDLSTLSNAGKIQKIHSGAILPRLVGEGLFQQRMGESVAEKRRIAKNACSLILPSETLFIDTGSTTLMFAEELTAIDDLTVITNSSDIAKIISTNDSAQVFLVGGHYSADNRETTGPMAISQIRKFRVDHVILTIGGIHAKAGVTDFNIDEALIAQAMIEQADNIIVLADSSKFNQIAPFEVTSLKQIGSFVCSSKPDKVLDDALERANVKTVVTI